MDSSKWICLALACMVSGMLFSLTFSFGAVFVEMMNTYQADRSTAATVQSLLIGVSLSFGVISGVLINKFGLSKTTFVSSLLVPLGFAMSYFVTDIYHLYITIGVIAGIGISLSHVSAVISVSRIFADNEKQRVICATIHSTWGSIAGIIYPYFLKWLVKSYGLSGTFLILGGVYCNTFCFFVFLWQQHRSGTLSDRSQKRRKAENASQVSSLYMEARSIFETLKLLISIPFLCLIIGNGLTLASLNGYLEHAFDIAEWKGYRESETKELFVILNCLNVLATITPGLVKCRFDVHPFIFLILSSLAGCVGHMLIYASTNYLTYAVASGCVGLVSGGIFSGSIIFIMETMQKEQVSVAIGSMLTVNGLLSAGSGQLFGRGCPLPKKGDSGLCSNYRGITLLSVPAKIFNRVILEQLKGPVDKKLRDQQAGFRKDRSCTDQIATLRIIIEQSIEWNSPLYINFVDYEKAIDSLDREMLWKLLRHYGVPQKVCKN
ncbi:monocarboxylate transporter 2-like [Ruditapes philippinarum]|uniref:monocarboxylate transporter 2-like n=1 Tax=Ruditapes philippinarum TaxID=129788 RepID=UPI00295AED4F|nr:monocarboxylate transporter 2-like [Ruditapes philippinarum]